MKRARCEELIERHGADAIVEALGPFVTERRRARIDAVLQHRIRGVEVAVESPSDPHNAAAVVRTAEAFGVLGVHLIAAEGEATGAGRPRARARRPAAPLHAKSTTQGSYHWVETQHHDSLETFLARRTPRALFGAWMDAPVAVEDIPVDRPVCLLFGNESRGLSASARGACDGGFRIPMFGMSESLNLSVSAAITLYEVCRRRRAATGASDLDREERERLRARYYMHSVDDRLLVGVFGEGTIDRRREELGS